MTAAFEGWAVLELLGHRVRYGRVSEVIVFGEPFCRIDIPGDPPTFELYAGKSVYGLRPASEESIRAYHAPRPMLEARTSREVVVDDDDWDGDGEPIAPTCGGCSEPLGSEPTVLVTDSDTSDNEVWHKRCAEDDAERVDRSTTIDTVGENAGRG